VAVLQYSTGWLMTEMGYYYGVNAAAAAFCGVTHQKRGAALNGGGAEARVWPSGWPAATCLPFADLS